jgi:hypothetical protein
MGDSSCFGAGPGQDGRRPGGADFGRGGYREIAAHGRASGTPRHGTAHDEHRLTLKFQIFLARIRVVQGFVSAVKVLVSPSSVDSKTEFDR